MARLSPLAAFAVAASILAGCASSDRGKDEHDDGELRELPAELRDRVFAVDSSQWKGSVRHGEESKPLTISSLQTGDYYGIDDVQFLFVARDGKYEVLVDTQRRVGRVRLVDGDASVGLRCRETALEQWNRLYECTPGGAPLEKFEKFDKGDYERARGFFWLPSSPPSAQKGLIDKAIERIGAKRLKGVTSSDSKPCVAEVEIGEVSGELRVSLFQVPDDGERKKLVGFEAPEGAILGALEADDFIALQSQVRSTTNQSEIQDRKLLVNRSDRDGLKVEIISSDNGGASGKYCRKLEPATD